MMSQQANLISLYIKTMKGDFLHLDTTSINDLGVCRIWERLGNYAQIWKDRDPDRDPTKGHFGQYFDEKSQSCKAVTKDYCTSKNFLFAQGVAHTRPNSHHLPINFNRCYEVEK